jgi:hypothetical protein
MQPFEKRKRSKQKDVLCYFSFEIPFNMRRKQNPVLIYFIFSNMMQNYATERKRHNQQQTMFFSFSSAFYQRKN